jgi:hypothetical protein
MTHTLKYVKLDKSISYYSDKGFTKSITKASKMSSEEATKKLNKLKPTFNRYGDLFLVNVIKEVFELEKEKNAALKEIELKYKQLGLI